ncbi:uncharacterized protein L203_103221 [Cryptococcus depauperatus CBS 7841]|uniref:Uncharacterized protein n=1 Tax=Cryptococcus depauperatus CBS 7841 TaxID=1295531 RepID=A0AAJ8M1W0_9TREE
MQAAQRRVHSALLFTHTYPPPVENVDSEFPLLNAVYLIPTAYPFHSQSTRRPIRVRPATVERKMPFNLITPPVTTQPSQYEQDDCFFSAFSCYNRRTSSSSDGDGEDSSPSEGNESVGEPSLSRKSRSLETLDGGYTSKDQDLHTPPVSSPTTSPTFCPPSLPTRPSMVRATSDTASARSHSAPMFHPIRASRPRGLSPLMPMTPCNPNRQSGMPKSQPLSRALFARMADTPGGMGSKGAGHKQQKIIVPTKSFKTSFTLDMTSSELARR